MKANSTKTLLYVSISVFVVLVVGLVIMVLWLQNRNKKVAESRVELENDVAMMRSMQQVRRSVMSSYDEQAEMAEYFIDEDSIPYFLGTLEAAGVQAGVITTISSVTLSPDRDQLGVALRAQGSFANLHQYIKVLEYAPFRMTLRRVSLQQLPGDAGPINNWSADLTLTLESYTETRLPSVMRQ